MSNGVDFRKLALDLREQLTRKDEAYQGAHMMCQDLKNELAALREELAALGTVNNQLSDQLEADREEYWLSNTAMRQSLTAAEQRNAELVELLDSAFFRLDTFIEAEREMPVPSMEVLRDAILRHCPTLKPEEPGPIQVDCGECPNITDGCHGSCMKAKPTESGASE